MNSNRIYCGDNLDVLSKLPEKSVDLIYADPPFFSNRHYEVIWNDGAEVRAFEDRWQGGIEHYISWMKPRLAQCHRVLKDTGSMYLHCDWHANAHLRILMDEIFGESNFQNEIIWCYRGGGNSKSRFARKHDNIFFYSKGNNYTFNSQFVEYSDASKKLVSSRNGISIDGKTRDLERGAHMPDWWGDFNSLQTWSPERIGYPTQKPEALLRRIIEASSDKDNMVLDPFSGCGTCISVAHQLDRQWIGIDVSPTACRMMKDRLIKIGASVELIDMPSSPNELKNLEPFAFQDWVINKVGGTHQVKKSNDKGIDGWTFLEHKPIQIKQSDNIGRNVIDNFETAIEWAGYKEGYIYAFSFGKGAIEEIARADNKRGLVIHPITISELVNGDLDVRH